MSDDFVTQKLQEWGIPHCQQLFKEKGISEHVLPLLSDNDINDLLPGFGDRIVFKHHHKQFVQILNNNNTIVFTVPGDFESPSTSGSASVEVLTGINLTQSVSHVAPLNDPEPLRSVVKRSGYGRALLALKRRLRMKERRALCDFIVDDHLKDDVDTRILPSEFKDWADQLSLIFPQDRSSLWYSPRTKVSGVTIVANGSLLAAYYGFRRDIAEMNDDYDDEDEDVDDVEPLSENDAAELAWLKANLEPWSEVTNKWQSSAEARKALREQKKFDVTNYLTDFKCLRQPSGHLLIQIDFQQLYEDKSTKLYDKVESFVSTIFEELKTVRPCPRELKALLKQQELLLKSGGKLSTTSILMALCHLVPVHTVSKKKKATGDEIKGWRPNRKEVQDGFVTHIDDVSKLHETINRRDRKFLDVRQTRQPFVVIVGQDLDNITASYVSINDFLYLMGSPLEAIDVCFKSVFALSVKYSIESRPLWMLLQTYVYEIFTSLDKASATASTVSLLARFNINLQ